MKTFEFETSPRGLVLTEDTTAKHAHVVVNPRPVGEVLLAAVILGALGGVVVGTMLFTLLK